MLRLQARISGFGHPLRIRVPNSVPAVVEDLLSSAASPVRRSIRDFEAFRKVFADWDGSFHQMSRGRFEGAVHVDAGRKLRVFQAWTNQSILTRGVDHAPLMTFIPITKGNARAV